MRGELATYTATTAIKIAVGKLKCVGVEILLLPAFLGYIRTQVDTDG